MHLGELTAHLVFLLLQPEHYPKGERKEKKKAKEIKKETGRRRSFIGCLGCWNTGHTVVGGVLGFELEHAHDRLEALDFGLQALVLLLRHVLQFQQFLRNNAFQHVSFRVDSIEGNRGTHADGVSDVTFSSSKRKMIRFLLLLLLLMLLLLACPSIVSP